MVQRAEHAGPLVDLSIGVGDRVAMVGVGLSRCQGNLVVVIQVADVLESDHRAVVAMA